jgi:hypothetical protein
MAKKAHDIEVDGIDWSDYPDFSDAFIVSAKHEDGTEFTDEEIEELNEDRDLVYKSVEDVLY